MRVFLSHSSKDKERYCNKVADALIQKLGKDSIVYDAVTFETGEKSLDEINRTLSISDLYVIMLSDNAVESDWVKYELREAHKKLNNHTLDRVFPIIIDSNLSYKDERIPDWLRDYNLKYIARPAKTAKLIIERAKNVHWSRHPSFQNRDSVFVGRNDLINKFEKRIDNFEMPPLHTFIVSGLPKIGRKSLARQCCIKGTIIPTYYEFSSISLNYQESIEDFIVKINDLGLTDKDSIARLASKSLDEKIGIATTLSTQVSRLSEIILIKDEGCLIDYRGNMAEWFKRIINSTGEFERITFIIITKYKVTFEAIRNTEGIAYLNVPELTTIERKGLLRRLAEANGLALNRIQLESISQYLTGYPAQVHYAIDIIKHSGFPFLSRNYKMLIQYNEQEVSILLEKYKDNKKVFDILALIAKYDAISTVMLYEILESTDGYIDVYEKLFQESFFELEGVNNEYIRLNEVVRNYISRSNAKALPQHLKKAQELFYDMFTDDSTTWYDSNDFLLAVRQTVIEGKEIQFSQIIPSVYLKSMTDLYANMQFDNVVKLARLALEHSGNIDKNIQHEIQYLLCLALAKQKSSECLSEVELLDYDDKKFITAFYYRQIGNNDKALIFLNEILSKRPDLSKAKREKVLILKNLQQFDEALALAKENYYLYSDNPYHIQAYFDCLINSNSGKDDVELLGDLLERLSRIQSEKAQSMYYRCLSLYITYIEQDYKRAIKTINQVIEEYPLDKKYALTIKFEIARFFHDFPGMEKAIKELEEDGVKNNTIVICRSKLLADQEKRTEAVDYFRKHIRYFTEQSKDAFCEKLNSNQR